MGTFGSGRLAAGVGIGMAVAAIAGTGVAMAAGSSSVIDACYNSSGRLRIATTCRSSETAVSWNRTGPQGPAGPAGATKVQVVKRSAAVGTSTEADLAAVCPSGTTLTGGGGEVSPNGIANAYLTASSPYTGGGTSPIGWHIIGTNNSGTTLTFSVYALCAAP